MKKQSFTNTKPYKLVKTNDCGDMDTPVGLDSEDHSGSHFKTSTVKAKTGLIVNSDDASPSEVSSKSSVFEVSKGCKGKRNKCMLNYDQITILENYFFKDPKWTSATVKQASKELNMNFKKIYKWGYDRKRVSRNLIKIKNEVSQEDQFFNPSIKDSGSTGDFEIYTSIKKAKSSDYNDMVDEIIALHAKDGLSKNVNLKRKCHSALVKGNNAPKINLVQSSDEDRYWYFDDYKNTYQNQLANSGDQKNCNSEMLNETEMELKMEGHYFEEDFHKNMFGSNDHELNDCNYIHQLEKELSTFSPNYEKPLERDVFTRAYSEFDIFRSEYF